jgi:hypothetical protein
MDQNIDGSTDGPRNHGPSVDPSIFWKFILGHHLVHGKKNLKERQIKMY